MQPGDVVRLKSGGPQMTVTRVTGTEVDCIWFFEYKPQSYTFNSAVLVKAHD